MTRVALLVRRLRDLPFSRPVDRSGTPGRLPIYRLFLRTLLVPPDYVGDGPPDVPDATRQLDLVVDTGSLLSVLPAAVWGPFESEIRGWMWCRVHRNLGSRYSAGRGRIGSGR